MKNLKQLPDSEFRIMDIVWNNENPITSKEIYDLQKSDEKLSMSAIHTLLQRLVTKGYLTSSKIGKERQYKFTIEKEQYLKFETKTYIDKRLGKSSFHIMRALIEDGSLDSDEISQLRDLLQEKEVK